MLIRDRQSVNPSEELINKFIAHCYFVMFFGVKNEL